MRPGGIKGERGSASERGREEDDVGGRTGRRKGRSIMERTEGKVMERKGR